MAEALKDRSSVGELSSSSDESEGLEEGSVATSDVVTSVSGTLLKSTSSSTTSSGLTPFASAWGKKHKRSPGDAGQLRLLYGDVAGRPRVVSMIEQLPSRGVI